MAGRSVGSKLKKPDPKRVFVVHGRNLKARDAMFKFIRSLGLQPVEWTEAIHATGKASPYIGEILEAAFAMAGAFIVLMTPDDEAQLRQVFWSASDPDWEHRPTPQPRPNVLFEAGMALGQFPDRTVLVELGKVREFSDIHGRHVIRMTNATYQRNDLALRLKAANCPVKLSGRKWRTAGDFASCLL